MNVFLTGSTGFVGSGMVPALVAAGHHVVCLVRPGSADKFRREPSWQGRVEMREGDLFHRDSLIKAMEDCEAVIHLVGIIREFPRQSITFSRIHVEGTKNVLAAAKQCGVRHIVHMSALGTRPDAVSPYHRTKYEAEQAVMNSGIPFTIFRPSVIFGPGDEFVNMLAELVRLPVTPVVGDGSYPLQPVSRQTVADVFVQSLTLPEARQQIYEVGGPEPVTYEQILDTIGRVIGKPVRKLRIPLSVMKPVVQLMEGFRFFPLTGSQLTMLTEGNTCQDTERLYQTFQTKKIPFEEGIRSYLNR